MARKQVGDDSGASSLPILVSNFGLLHSHSGVDSYPTSQSHNHQSNGQPLCPLTWMAGYPSMWAATGDIFAQAETPVAKHHPGKECYQVHHRCRLCSDHT